MTQGVNRRFFLDNTFGQSRFEGPLYTAGMHRLGRLWVTPGGKEPLGVAVSLPLLAQQGQCCCGERDIAVFGPFALPDMNEQTVAVNVGDLQVYTFLQT